MTKEVRQVPVDTLLSVIVPVYDRPAELQLCLSALMAQESAPPFEIIVVDDGSKNAVRAAAAGHHAELVPRMIRQEHAGPGSARNAGIAAAAGSMLVFVDSDVIVSRTFLRVLADAVREHPESVAFQIRLASTGSQLHCRIENARLAAIQSILARRDGSIDYVNTSAFAVRRSYASRTAEFFDTNVSRGEDTLVLTQLASQRHPPRFVPGTTADHRPPGGLTRYLIKHLAIGYHGRVARIQLARSGGIALSGRDRLRMLRYLAENSGGGLPGAVVTALAVLAYTAEICGRAASRCPPGRWPPGRWPDRRTAPGG